ncbi:hypothetical protein ACTA71_002963 [Dictyostelium dimigraforme]
MVIVIISTICFLQDVFEDQKNDRQKSFSLVSMKIKPNISLLNYHRRDKGSFTTKIVNYLDQQSINNLNSSSMNQVRTKEQHGEHHQKVKTTKLSANQKTTVTMFLMSLKFLLFFDVVNVNVVDITTTIAEIVTTLTISTLTTATITKLATSTNNSDLLTMATTLIKGEMVRQLTTSTNDNNIQQR